MTGTTVRKSYSKAFVLDRSKLQRILTIIEKRVPELGGEFDPEFLVRLKNGRELILRSGQQLLALDNPVKNPIVSIDMSVPRDSPPVRILLRYGSTRTFNISLDVSSPDPKWSNQVFAELEEQIERTLLPSTARLLIRTPQLLLFCIPLTILALTIFTNTAEPDASSSSRSPGRVLLRRANSAQTDHDRLQIVFEKVRADLARENQEPAPEPATVVDWDRLLSWKTLFVALPVATLLGVLIYLAAVCYPWAVFAWGDVEQHYASVVAKRKSLWTLVVISLLIGIMSNLFVSSLPLKR